MLLMLLLLLLLLLKLLKLLRLLLDLPRFLDSPAMQCQLPLQNRERRPLQVQHLSSVQDLSHLIGIP